MESGSKKVFCYYDQDNPVDEQGSDNSDVASGSQPTRPPALEVTIHEALNPSYGMYVWPCAPVLAQYVWHNREHLKGKSVLELGAGTALPGIVAAKVGARVTLSDKCDLKHCLQMSRDNAAANGVEDAVTVVGLSWGRFGSVLLTLGEVDVILGSDCFYDPTVFEDILVTVSFILRKNPHGRFWFSYQERSADWSIEALLIKWNLTFKYVPLEEFAGSLCDDARVHSIQLFVISPKL